MAGKKGMKGGGGKRAGAGRKRAAPAIEVAPAAPTLPAVPSDPAEFLTLVMQGRIAANPGQIQAANAMLRFQIKGTGTGKKAERAGAAQEAAKGKYAPSAPPKLMAVR